jgi:hypothetical protein
MDRAVIKGLAMSARAVTYPECANRILPPWPTVARWSSIHRSAADLLFTFLDAGYESTAVYDSRRIGVSPQAPLPTYAILGS